MQARECDSDDLESMPGDEKREENKEEQIEEKEPSSPVKEYDQG
jgi:hypothetical protein